jgi:hypothetical protein
MRSAELKKVSGSSDRLGLGIVSALGHEYRSASSPALPVAPIPDQQGRPSIEEWNGDGPVRYQSPIGVRVFAQVARRDDEVEPDRDVDDRFDGGPLQTQKAPLDWPFVVLPGTINPHDVSTATLESLAGRRGTW